jgi:hypothetical protein
MFGHAIVIGGSVAGLLAGRVLSDHIGHLTLHNTDIYQTFLEVIHKRALGVS